MPEPYNKKYSLDNYIYTAIKQLPKSYCILEPNYITLFNYLISFLVLYFIYNDKSLLLIFLLAVFRSFLDILDGAIARKCNKYSDLGDKLDHYGDYIYIILLIIIIYLKTKNKYLKFIYLLFSIYLLYLLYNKLVYKKLSNNKLIILIQDNIIISYPLLIVLLIIKI